MWHPECRAMRLLFLLLLTSVSRVTPSQSLPRRRWVDPDSTTDPSQFYRRAWHSSVLLGDTIYIDGGECTYSTSDGPISYPYNATYSLDLSSSWSPDNAKFYKIDKGDSPVYNTPNIWPAPNNKTFYSVNGDITLAGQHRADPPATTELWQFAPSGIASGQWRLAGYATSLIGTTRAKSTYGSGSAHILGGFSFDRTSALTDHIGTSNGIVSYNMQTGQWQNRSMGSFAPAGFWIDGHMHFVGSLGGNGTVIAFGGVTVDSQGDQAFTNFNNIGLFNPDIGEWRSQSATGDIPQGRRLACSVGVAGDNGTYEIFIHGGSAYPNNNQAQVVPQVTIDLDQVWVLSIPSFTWYKSTYKPAVPRWTHTCHVPGNPPRRQMIAIGGTTPDIETRFESQDPWPQGLGTFDLTQMEWSNSYDANTDLYVTPQVVKDSIAKNGLYPPMWDDPDTPRWLTGKSASELLTADSSTGTKTSNSSSAGTDNTSDNPSNATNTADKNSNNHNTPDNSSASNNLSAGVLVAIVIGVVVGIVVILYLLGKRFKWPTLSMRKGIRHRQPISDRWEKPELENTTRTRIKGQELNGISFVRYEMSGAGLVELPGEYKGQSDNRFHIFEASHGTRTL